MPPAAARRCGKGVPALTRFTEAIAVDWSGQAVARPKGLAVARAGAGDAPPRLIEPDGGWSRADLLTLFGRVADAGSDTLIGLDLSPAFAFADACAYFPGWAESPSDAKSLWALVDRLSNEDPHLAANGFLAHPEARRHFRQRFDRGDLYPAGAGRMRVCEHGQRAMGLSPYSCFNLVGASQVGKSSLTGMRVFHHLDGRIPFWPFDPVPERGPVLVEIYTALPARLAGLRKGISKIRDAATLDAALATFGSAPHGPLSRGDDHATDALLAAAWLRRAGEDAALWKPKALTAELARTEGWTFGVV